MQSAHDTQRPIRRALLRWYDRRRRDLPWRRTRKPYAIWVAETMLQQTQVKTVIPYYGRFLEAFPTIEALAKARRDKVLALWSGLGYYRRALNLQSAAKKIIREHRGNLPRDWQALRALPGIGDYTAGALMSIAFRRRYPALDGNARRALTRLFGLTTEHELRRVAAELVSPSRPGEFNQALMELGSTICLPRNPLCPQCPVRCYCSARRSGIIHRLLPSSKSPIRKIDWPLAVIQKDGKILLRRRPESGILAGLWELPGGERRKGESLKAVFSRHLDSLGARVMAKSAAGVIRHSITNRNIRAPVYRCRFRGNLPIANRRWRWLSLSILESFPLSTMSRKALKLVTRP
jgi:A/G-specific adenine glycosylase